MDEFWSFAGVIVLWLGVSCGLWWLHRRSVHAGQRRQMRQAVRAAAYVADGQKILDTIRRSTLLHSDTTGPALSAETHALLKRMQDRSGFFDKVNALRIDMLAAFGMDDYPPLSELLHIRRDLWAASEILLVEDLSGFGESFAEPGAYERFRAEAAALLFKADGARTADEDVIDLRLSLARAEAERFIPELKEAIRLARERDRLPTFAEIVAYPIAAIRALPGRLRIARAFLLEFYRYAAEIAGAIRRSETVERGASELRRAREELPRRLVTGFERASEAARQSASGLRRHYDFLVAAHDFQAKYEQTLRRAPQITERGRQFIARLELAEHSERLRLTSANLLIWLTRQLATGLAHFLAGLQEMQAVLSETPPGALAAALVAPTPVRGRHLPRFRSYRMALGASGLTESRPQLPPGAEQSVITTRKHAETSMVAASAKGKRGKLPAAKPAKIKEPVSAAEAAREPIKPEPPIRAVSAPKAKPNADKADAAKAAKSMPKAAKPVLLATQSASKAASPVAKTPPPPPAAKVSRIAGKQEAKPAASERTDPRPAAPTSKANPTAPEAPPRLNAADQKRAEAATQPQKPGLAPKVTSAPPAEPLPAEKRRSFLDRLLGRRPAEPTIGDLLAAAWEREHAADVGDTVAAPIAAETAPTLLAKLSELPEEDLPDEREEESVSQDEPIADDAEDESGEDPESLTSSVMEVQAKLAPKPQIRSFPWLRG